MIAAVWYVVSGVLGTDEPGMNKFGTAGWFAVMGSAVLAAGWALWTGRQWGRGLAVFAQLILLAVAWYMRYGSGQWLAGVPVAVVVLAVLGPAVQPVGAAVGGGSGFGAAPTTPGQTPGR